MKVFQHFTLALLAGLLFTACDNEIIEPEPDGPTTLECSYTSALVLTNHNPDGVDYVVANCDLEINGSLTIEPGTTIQFNNGYGMYIKGNGSIVAVGKDTLPITFTGTSATTANWKGISIESNNVLNKLEFCRIQAAGFGDDNFVVSQSGFSYSADAAVSVYGRLAMSRCTISNSGGHGIAADADATITGLTNDTLSRCAGYAVYLSAKVAGQPDLASCTFSNNTQNKVALYGYTSNSEWPGTHTLKALSIPYYVVTDLGITEGAVTLEAGVTLEFAADRALYVNAEGSIVAAGTSAKHVTIRGEQALAGWWAGILVDTNNAANAFTYTDFSDGGSREIGFIARRATISVSDYSESQLALTNCTVTSYQGTCQAAYNANFGSLTNNSPAITAVCAVE